MPTVTSRKTVKEKLEAIVKAAGLDWDEVKHFSFITVAALVDRKERKARKRGLTRAALDRAPPGSVVHCDVCDGVYSATPADYFMMAPSDKFTCCGADCALVVRHVEIVRVGT